MRWPLELSNSETQECGNSELQTQNSKPRSSEGQTYCARILIESARFPPFGFDTVEISSNSNEDIPFLRKKLLCQDFDRERSVSPPRVRYSGDQLEFEPLSEKFFYVTCNVLDADYNGDAAACSRVRYAYSRVQDA